MGDNVKIGAGAVVLKDIPRDCTAVGVPARVVRHKGMKLDDLEHGHIDDPVQTKLNELERRIASLEKGDGAARNGKGRE